MLRPPPISTLFPYTTLFRSYTPEEPPAYAPWSTITIWQHTNQALYPGIGRVDESFLDRKSTRLNSSHRCISYAVFCLKKKNQAENSALAAGTTKNGWASPLR